MQHISKPSTQALLLALAISNLHTDNGNKPNQELIDNLAKDWDQHTMHHFYTNSDDGVFNQTPIQDLMDIYDPAEDYPKTDNFTLPDIQDEAAFTKYFTDLLDKHTNYLGTYFKFQDPETHKIHTIILTLDI